MSLLPDNTALYSVVIELGAAEMGFIEPTLSRAIHGQVLAWFNLGDPEIAIAIHDAQESPLSMSGLLGNRRPKGTKVGDRFYFRIGLLDGKLIQPLLRGIENWGREPLILAKFPFALRSIYTLPGTHSLAGSADYRLLANLPLSSQNLTLNFLSPTSFKQAQGIQPLPLPELVFGSLLRRWNAFAPHDCKFQPVEWKALVSACELKTHALKMEGGAEIGVQGSVRYRFLEAEQAKIATTLAHFAFFAGVGRKTSMGMGQVKLELLSQNREQEDFKNE